MRSCDLTLPTPAENLACDEALLDACEAGTGTEVLRFWESAEYFVVVGYANATATEVNLAYCEQNAISVLRRCTGGGTVLQGPGCLNYSVVLRIDGAAVLENIRSTNEFIMKRHEAALTAALGAPVDWVGQTDLASGGLKFSGNAQRRHKNSLLFHGTFLLHMDLALIALALRPPSKQPEYRQGRSHAEFLTNLNLPAARLKTVLIDTWSAKEPLARIPLSQIARLVEERYSCPDWNRKF